MKSLKPRLMTAVIGISLLIGILCLSQLWNPLLGLVTGAATALMICEYLSANKLFGAPSVSVPCIAAAVFIPIFVDSSFFYIIVICYLMLMFALMVINHRRVKYTQLAYAVSGTLLISLGMSALPKICVGSGCFAFFFIAVFAIPWMTDAGGFFVGAWMGKHKLCPEISPKKTVEGAVGGVAFGIITSVLLGFIFKIALGSQISVSFLPLILLGIVDAVVSIIGDLSFSLIKRCCKIKDYGTIFPGHGGMLDRFDSIIFTAPVAVAINQIFPIISVVSA